MRILLINPVIKGDFNTLHLGIASVASYINAKSKHKAFIADLAFKRKAWKKYVDNRITSDEPDIIGIYISTPMLTYAKEVMRYIKKKHNLPILAGGHHVTLCADSAIKIEDIDYIIVGEGEHVVKDFLDRLERKENLKGVRGLWYKKDGKIGKNKIRDINTNLDELPPIDWDLYNDIDKQLYFYEYIPSIGNRGCTYKCSFCSVNPLRERIAKGKNELYYREKDPKLVVAEAKVLWEKYGKKGMKFIRFSEPIFTTNIEWLKEFRDEYIKAGLKGKPFSVYSMANEFDEERARILAEIGCKVVRTGLETEDGYIRKKVLEKDITMHEIKNITKLCKKYGIEVLGYFMYGAPGETKHSMRKTYKLIKNLDIDLPVILIFKPLPKTKILKKIKEEGFHINKKRFNRIDNFYDTAVIESKWLSTRDVELYQARSYIYIFFRRLISEIKYRKLNFFLHFPSYSVKGIKYKMPLVVIIRSYISRRRVE